MAPLELLCRLYLIVAGLSALGCVVSLLGSLRNLRPHLSFQGANFTVGESGTLFECATSGKSSASWAYEVNSLCVCVAFLVYELDLMFFLPELLQLQALGSGDLAIVSIYFFCFCLGLWVDHRGFGLTWSL